MRTLPRTSTRVLFFPCGGINNACARTRLYAYLPYLPDYGLRWHLASYTWHKYDRPGGNAHRSLGSKLWLELLPLRTFLYFFRAHTLFFQKREIPKFYAWAGKALGKRIVYDLDDAIYLETPEALADDAPHRIVTNEPVRRSIEWILNRANLALVSGDELARFCRQFTGHIQILPSVIPSASGGERGGEESGFPPLRGGTEGGSFVETDRGGAGKASRNSTPVIGWVGAPENQRYLREIEQLLMRLQSENPDLEIWIVTSREMDPPPRFRYRFIPWSREAEAEFIPQFTVGIAPLTDDPWCRAKMNYKALVYMAYGVPAVVTPVGFPVAEFEGGDSVLLAHTADDWYHHLHLLLMDPARRAEIATAGLEVVRRRFTAAARAPEFAAALKGWITGEISAAVPHGSAL